MGFLTVLWLLSFVCYMGNSGSHFELLIPLETWPLALGIIFIAVFFMPFNIFHRSSRLVLMKVPISIQGNLANPFFGNFLDLNVGDCISVWQSPIH